MHHSAIQHLTYPILNKWKLDNKQDHIQPPTRGLYDDIS